jgi:hypothetical protein
MRSVILANMTSRHLTAEQIDRMIAVADRQFAYYCKAWQRCQDNHIPIDDPLAAGLCHVGEAVRVWREELVKMKQRLPQLYRPLAKMEKTQGLASVDLPDAHRQRDAARAVAEHAKRPTPPG